MTTESKEKTRTEEQAIVRQQQEDNMIESLTKLLPQHIDVKRFIALSLAVYRDPNLRDCTNQSKMLALADCAKLGLIPDRNLGHVWLVPFRNRFEDPPGSKKWKSRLEVTLIPGYQGYIELARRSGQITTVHTGLVRGDDPFTHWIDEDGPHIRHTPINDDDTKITHAYCIAKLRNGSPQIEVMTIAQVMKVKNESAAGDKGPWKQWFDEMVRKTVVRRARKYWPQSAELANLGALDDYADGFVGRDQVDNNTQSAGLAAAPTGRLNLSDPAADPEPTIIEESPTPTSDNEAKGDAKTKTKTPPKQSKKTKAQEKPVSEQRENTESQMEPEDPAPVTAKKRQEWLAQRALDSVSVGDLTIATTVVRRWMMVNSITPSSLDIDSVFESTKKLMTGIDWQPIFDEHIEEQLQKSKAGK